MKKTLVGIALAATAAIGITAMPVNADVLYGTPGMTHRSIVRPVVVTPMYESRVISHPAVLAPRTFVQPTVVQRDNSLLRLRLWPLLDFRLF